MRRSVVILLSVCSSVYAESQFLAPVIDNSSYPSGSASNVEKPSNNAMYEIFGRLEQMQLEMQQLRGLVEEQSQMINELDKKQKNIYSDLDLRLQELTGGNTKQTPDEIMAIDNVQAESAISQVNSSTEGQPVSNTLIPADNAQNTMGEVVNEPVENEKELYQTAYELLRNGHNAQAIAEFKQLLNKFPDGQFASNSQYWLGEAYKVTNNIKAAKRAFSKVISHYGNSAKVPDALLKLGYIELEQRNKVNARDYLTKITVRYPDSTAAHLAKKKLMQMETLNP